MTSSSTLDRLLSLVSQLKQAKSPSEKCVILLADPHVKNGVRALPFLKAFLDQSSEETRLVLLSILAIGQGTKVFRELSQHEEGAKKVKELVKALEPVETFYSEIAGIVGYHAMMLQLLSMDEVKGKDHELRYHRPEGIDISEETPEVKKAILWGVEHLPKIAEIYPLGGAADRLRLRDEKTGKPLPAARLLFLGKTLLESMVCDLQAREYLHYKLFGRQIHVPVAIMTSIEKDNHAEILAICEELRWFGRPKESFRFFCQPSVPTINRLGDWCFAGVGKLLMKPGGHGVIWKLARDQGIFDWLLAQGVSKALVRQVNNPIAAVDHGLLAFTGLGCQLEKRFGFASCPRQVKASEGINVIVERKAEEGFAYAVTNIEYCDFTKYGIADEPKELGGVHSKYSSNTNILFADLRGILEALAVVPIPGMLMNMKKTAFCNDHGETQEEEIGRLESTMQNIADVFVDQSDVFLEEGSRKNLSTYVTYNKRGKTISTVKREFVLGASLLETPEGCFFDILRNARELLVGSCHFQVPGVHDGAVFFTHGPSFLFFYHPALGPLYSIIAQKIRRGRLYQGSEWQLEIADLDVEHLEIEGSLLIRADAVMGDRDQQGILHYSESTGKCRLKNVRVINEGIDRDASNIFWKNEIFRKEVCEIVIRGNGEFVAEDVTLQGDLLIVVPSGMRVTALNRGGTLQLVQESIQAPTWNWTYQVGDASEIHLHT
jgi:hypothetical protein